jgi:hypothetical protein
MLTRVEVRTRQGALLQLPFEEVLNGYVVSSIDGLGPVKANLVSSSYAGQDGAQFQSARRESRNIVLKLELEPDYVNNDVESLRQQLYSFLMPKSEVDLKFITDKGLEVDITGRVESNEPSIFTQEPGVDVSVMCFESDFIDPDLVSIPGTSTELSTEMDIEYAGNIDTGFVLTLNFNRDESAITVYLTTPDGTLHQLDFAYTLLNGDKLVISTVDGAKGAWLTRTGIETSVLYGIPAANEWLKLSRGTNKLRVYATGTPDIPFTLEYYTRYGGL